MTSEPALNCVCNCNNCKKRTGSAFGISAYFPEHSFKVIKGTTKVYELQNEHGKQERHFCPECGTTLYWHVEIFKGLIGVAGGCFTENPLPSPRFNAMKENQCVWVSFPASMDKSLTAQDIPNA
nr:GFA family protein [Gammaproteobacteria bacterium]